MAKTTTHADYTATALTLTTAAQPNITTLGTLTTLTVDDITINGSTISDGGDLTLDVAGDIILDAGGNEIKLKTAGTEWGQIYNSSSDLAIYSAVQDKDIKLQGNDGGSVITALTLDMSDAGKAIFNSDLTIGNAAGNNQTLQVTNDNGNFQLQKYSDDVYLNLNDNGSIIFRHYGSSGSSVSQIFSFLPSGIAHFSNYVGIGISTNTANALHVKTDTDGNGITIQRDSTTENTYSQLGFSQTTNDAGTPNLWIRGYRGSSFSDNFMTLGTNNTERMRIQSGGTILFGLTTTSGIANSSGTGNEGAFIQQDGLIASSISNDNNLVLNRKTSNGVQIQFRFNGSNVGSISTNANSLPSDRNFKKDIEDLNIGLDLVSKLNPVSYNYKIDNDGTPKMYGLIAQDLEQSLEEVGVDKNSVQLLQHKPNDNEKESDYSLDYLKLTPILIKAIQELKAEIEELKENK